MVDWWPTCWKQFSQGKDRSKNNRPTPVFSDKNWCLSPTTFVASSLWISRHFWHKFRFRSRIPMSKKNLRFWSLNAKFADLIIPNAKTGWKRRTSLFTAYVRTKFGGSCKTLVPRWGVIRRAYFEYFFLELNVLWSSLFSWIFLDFFRTWKLA